MKELIVQCATYREAVPGQRSLYTLGRDRTNGPSPAGMVSYGMLKEQQQLYITIVPKLKCK